MPPPLLVYSVLRNAHDCYSAPFASAANIIKGRTYHGALGHTGAPQ
jgi:hypothetical protein